MENAVDALKIAAAVLVFVIAITIAFALLSQAKSTSDIILFSSDKTNYYDYSKNFDGTNGRIVGTDVVISSLYRYYKESIVVRILPKRGAPIEFNTKTDGLGSQKARKEFVNAWINNETKKNDGILFYDERNHKDKKFLETFDEVKESGQYIKEDDGSEITIQSGQTSIWITYKEQ